jgi:hypothetical protein
VLLQSLEDEFSVPKGDPVATSAIPTEYLQLEPVDAKPVEQKLYRSGVGKLMHLVKWFRAGANSAVREISKFGGMPSKNHIRAMYRTMRYMLETPKRGLFLKPNGSWNGESNYEFTI